MAKKKTVSTGSNKTQAVRDQIAKLPRSATAAEIAKAASQEIGEEVSPSLVYAVKTKKKTKKRRKVGRPKGTAQAAAAAPASGGMNPQLVKEAALLLQKAGDAKAARNALDMATEIGKVFQK